MWQYELGKRYVKYHGFNSTISSDPDIIKRADKIILPGQGSFQTGVNNLKKNNLFELIKSKALVEKIPILGICLGMQILATKGFEDGFEKGLDLVPGKVDKLPEVNLKLPHIGWNQIKIKKKIYFLKILKMKLISILYIVMLLFVTILRISYPQQITKNHLFQLFLKVIFLVSSFTLKKV